MNNESGELLTIPMPRTISLKKSTVGRVWFSPCPADHTFMQPLNTAFFSTLPFQAPSRMRLPSTHILSHTT